MKKKNIISEYNSLSKIFVFLVIFILIINIIVLLIINDFIKIAKVIAISNGSILAAWLLFVWPLKYCLIDEHIIITSGILYRIKIKLANIIHIEEVYGIYLYGLSGNRFYPNSKKYKIIYKPEHSFRKQSVIISPSASFVDELVSLHVEND